MLRNLNDVEIPVIAAVNGPATIHSETPMMGDIVLATTHAEFADKAHFATRGTVRGDGVNIVWSELWADHRSTTCSPAFRSEPPRPGRSAS